MSWKQNNGRNRGHRDGVGEFLRGPGSSNSGEGVIGNSTTIKGNKFAYFDQTVEGSMIVVGSEGASLALDATVAATNILLGPTGSINTTLLDGLGPTGSINTTLLDGLGPTGSINTTLVDGLGPTGSINTSLKSIISGLTGIAGTVNIKGSTGLNIAQTSSGCLIVEGFTGPLALDATLLTTNTLLTDIKNQGVTGSSSTTIKGNQGINFAQDPTSGNMIVQGTVGITDTVPVSGTVAVSSVGGFVGVTGTVAVSSITNTVTVQGTTAGALALDNTLTTTIYNQLLLANWINQPVSTITTTLPNNTVINTGQPFGEGVYSLYANNPVTGDLVPYYNQVTIEGNWNIPAQLDPTVFTIYMQYSDDNNIWLYDGTKAIITDLIAFASNTYYFNFKRSNIIHRYIRFFSKSASQIVIINSATITLQYIPSVF